MKFYAISIILGKNVFIVKEKMMKLGGDELIFASKATTVWSQDKNFSFPFESDEYVNWTSHSCLAPRIRIKVKVGGGRKKGEKTNTEEESHVCI